MIRDDDIVGGIEDDIAPIACIGIKAPSSSTPLTALVVCDKSHTQDVRKMNGNADEERLNIIDKLKEGKMMESKLGKLPIMLTPDSIKTTRKFSVSLFFLCLLQKLFY